MKMSTRGRYGLRLMLDLAANHGASPVMAESVAMRQDVSENYLHVLAKALKTAGLLVAFRGPRGGYLLARPPEEITVFDIVSAMEGRTSVVECVSDSVSCARSENCVTRQVWETVSRKIDETLAAITLQDLLEQQKTLNDNCVDYYKKK